MSNMNLYSTSEIHNCLNLLSTNDANGSTAVLRLNMAVNNLVRWETLRTRLGSQFQMEVPKISRRRSRSSHYTELGHFTLLFCRGRERKVQRFIEHAHSYCFAPRYLCSRLTYDGYSSTNLVSSHSIAACWYNIFCKHHWSNLVLKWSWLETTVGS